VHIFLKQPMETIVLGPISIGILAVSGATSVAIQSAQARELPRQSIVHGQRLEPRANDLKSLGVPDGNPSQAATVDRLYRELLHCSDVRCTTASRPGK
jgi:hypothetical protein